jgi:hypothetical protein
MRYRVDAPGGVRRTAKSPGQAGTVSLYFQRRGDNWTPNDNMNFTVGILCPQRPFDNYIAARNARSSLTYLTQTGFP